MTWHKRTLLSEIRVENGSSVKAVGYASTSDTNAQQYATDSEGQQRVQLREEELLARKQAVQTGEVGIRKEVVTEQQTINVPTTREEVVIERQGDVNVQDNDMIDEDR